MNTDPIAFFREDFPRFFNTGVAELAERASGGDDKAKARHADIAAARGGVHVLLEGEGGRDFVEGEFVGEHQRDAGTLPVAVQAAHIGQP